MRLVDADALVNTLKGLRALTNILSRSTERPLIPFDDMVRMVEKSPTIEPEPSIPISWIEGHIDWLKDMDNGFANITAMNIEIMLRKWREEQNETD